MSFSVTMPALGESVTEGTVTRWLKNEGDVVAIDEPLLEVSTDKVDTEIPSPAAGILQKIVVGIDQTVAVGAELAVISSDASASVAAPVQTPPAGCCGANPTSSSTSRAGCEPSCCAAASSNADSCYKWNNDCHNASTW